MTNLDILIAEDHGIVRMGTIFLIREMYTQVRITEAASFNSTIEYITEQRFDLLLLDVNMPGGNSIQMIDVIRLRQPRIPILIFSSYDEEVYALRYLKAGANGYIEKESEPAEIKKAIQKVLNGEVYASPSVQQQLFRHFANPAKETASGFHHLTNREIEVLRLLVRGLSSSAIKDLLHIQLSTVSTYKAKIFEKMNVTNVIELAEKIKYLDGASNSTTSA